jgi:hypothetical protein
MLYEVIVARRDHFCGDGARHVFLGQLGQKIGHMLRNPNHDARFVAVRQRLVFSRRHRNSLRHKWFPDNDVNAALDYTIATIK